MPQLHAHSVLASALNDFRVIRLDPDPISTTFLHDYSKVVHPFTSHDSLLVLLSIVHRSSYGPPPPPLSLSF